MESLVSADSRREILGGTKINMGLTPMNLRTLELAMRILEIHGEVHIVNCGGIVSLAEMGAWLQSLANGKTLCPKCDRALYYDAVEHHWRCGQGCKLTPQEASA